MLTPPRNAVRPSTISSLHDQQLAMVAPVGPVVAELQKLFLATWAEQKGEALAAKRYFPPPEAAGRHVVRAIGSTGSAARSICA